MEEHFGVKNLKVKDGIYYTGKISKEISFPSDSHQKLAKIEEQSFWFSHRNNIILHIAKKLNLDDNYFFDIGGGNGIVSKQLMKSGFNPVLVEPFEYGGRTAKKRGLKNIICSDLHSLDFQEKMRLAGSFDVIEHIEDDKNFVSVVYENMACGGLFFATVPAFQYLWSEADEEAGHFRRYNMSEIEQLFKSCGFKIRHKSYFFTYLIPLILLLGRKNSDSAGEEHTVRGVKKGIISMLNLIDRFIFKLFLGKFPGASIIIVGEK